jgi:hypothetical protein
LGSPEYVDVQARNGQIVLTPVRIQRSDEVRSKLAQLGLSQDDVAEAIAWARTSAQPTRLAAEPSPVYQTGVPARVKKPRAAR